MYWKSVYENLETLRYWLIGDSASGLKRWNDLSLRLTVSDVKSWHVIYPPITRNAWPSKSIFNFGLSRVQNINLTIFLNVYVFDVLRRIWTRYLYLRTPTPFNSRFQVSIYPDLSKHCARQIAITFRRLGCIFFNIKYHPLRTTKGIEKLEGQTDHHVQVRPRYLRYRPPFYSRFMLPLRFSSQNWVFTSDTCSYDYLLYCI